MPKQSSADLLSFADQLDARDRPPVHKWNPEFCGEMDLRITRSGVWMYQSSPINRDRLVKLLSSILRLDGDGEYYLVTPAEKLRIRVDDVPFLGVELQVDRKAGHQRLLFRTNVGDIILMDASHPIRVVEDEVSGEPSPYLMVRDGLEARLTRPVFYQIVDLAIERYDTSEGRVGVWSCGTFFNLGSNCEGI